MELFLNLCWLSLLVPGFVLWRRRTVSPPSRHPLIFVCVLGCALILLFPVISVTDDLHAMRPEMEESERSFRHTGNCACAVHGLAQSSHFVEPGSTLPSVIFEQIGKSKNFRLQTLATFLAPATPGRAPPFAHPTSV
jgi:hypothetical protein